MSTFMQKKESVVRKWYILDAANKPLGKTAVAAGQPICCAARTLPNSPLMSTAEIS